jgi:putative ABC transport system permease protein
MIKNYFKIAFRGFWKHKLFTLINIIGLTIGISAALVIFLIVQFDFSFDKFHKDGNRIYRVVTNYTFQGLPGYNPGLCGPMFPAIKTDISDIEIAAPILKLPQPNVFCLNNKTFETKFRLQNDVILADENYFRIFQYKWIVGSPTSTLSSPYQVVLTSSQAKKYFPSLTYDQMPGRILMYDSIQTTVTGIVEPFKENTDLTFHDFISYSTAFANSNLKTQLRLHNWGGTNFNAQLFVKLATGIAPVGIEKQLADILKRNYQPRPDEKGNTHTFQLQPLSDIHFNERYGTFGNSRVANTTTLYELLTIAVFILLLGCINFVNLTTAQSTQRAKEIGIRKTMGSSRPQLVFQFLSETFFITLIAVIVSITLAPVILKLFADFIPAGINADVIRQPAMLLFLTVLTIAVSLFSGLYPALILSGYKPVMVLKNQAMSNSHMSRTAWVRKSLTVTQFVVAQFFIMATVLVSKQIYYALHKDLGFKKDAILMVNSPGRNRMMSKNLVFMDKLRNLPQVELVSNGHDAPTSDMTNSTESTYKDGKKEIKIADMAEKFGDENYIKLYHIKLLAGRNLQPDDAGHAILINMTFARRIGFNDPHAVVSKMIENFNGDSRMQIVGVVADFYQESLHSGIAPLAILTSNDREFNGTFHIALKPQTADGNEWKQAIASIEKFWKEVYPDEEFNYIFFDESLGRLYSDEQHISTLLRWAMGLSIVISCLGLLGLSVYTTNQRTKEIGVRKVLGASVIQVVSLLSSEMIWLILLAFAIVTPVAWWGMNKWIQGFADHTPISWWIFIVSGGGMLITALIISGFQTVRAATANPAQSLRTD